VRYFTYRKPSPGPVEDFRCATTLQLHLLYLDITVNHQLPREL
jgi:hypothetical protein